MEQREQQGTSIERRGGNVRGKGDTKKKQKCSTHDTRQPTTTHQHVSSERI